MVPNSFLGWGRTPWWGGWRRRIWSLTMSIRFGGRIGPISVSTGTSGSYVESFSDLWNAYKDDQREKIGLVAEGIELGISDAELIATLRVYGQVDRDYAKSLV